MKQGLMGKRGPPYHEEHANTHSKPTPTADRSCPAVNGLDLPEGPPGQAPVFLTLCNARFAGLLLSVTIIMIPDGAFTVG